MYDEVPCSLIRFYNSCFEKDWGNGLFSQPEPLGSRQRDSRSDPDILPQACLTRDITLCFWTLAHLQLLYPSYLQVVVKDFDFKPPFDRPGIQLPYLSIWFRWKEYSGDKAMTSLPRQSMRTRKNHQKKESRAERRVLFLIPSAPLHGGIASCHAAGRREGWLAPYLINKWESDSSTGYPDRFKIPFLKRLGLASKLQEV